MLSEYKVKLNFGERENYKIIVEAESLEKANLEVSRMIEEKKVIVRKDSSYNIIGYNMGLVLTYVIY